MESLSCSLNLNHQQPTTISHSPPHAISSSSSRPPTSTTTTTTTAALLNPEKSKKAASSSPLVPPLLPLPPSRPLFPSPLKFLWFGRDHTPSKSSDNSLIPSRIADIDVEDAGSTIKPCTCFTGTESHPSDAEQLIDINDSTNAEEIISDISPQTLMAESSSLRNADNGSRSTTHTTHSSSASDKNWITQFLQSRFLSKAGHADPDDRSSRELVESALLIAVEEADQAYKVNFSGTIDGDGVADNDINDDRSNEGLGPSVDDEQGLCMLKPGQEERVVHDRQSVSRFLHEVPVAEVQAISKLCLLSNMAYIIPEMQSKHLLKDHQLSFVTSSLVRKEEAEASKVALEHAAAHASKQKSRGAQKRSKAKEDNAESNGAACIEEAPDKASSRSEIMMCTETLLKEERLHVAHDVKANSEKVSILEETKTEAAKESTSKVQDTCPCEWFICDDEASSTRYLVIQGSESLASWQTNLSFAPTKFEGLGVLVHKGIYEAAQGLYKMVESKIEEHIKKGPHARVCFTGHSLGGSLATLLAMMLVKRGVVSASAVEGVVTLGAPCVLCAGERLLGQLGLQERQFVNVVMHRDIVPRAFACDYPDHVARLLKRVNATFRDHPCLNYQHLLYVPVGQVMILQPDDTQSPSHPLLPTTSGLYVIKHPHNQEDQDQLITSQASMEVREAQRAFFNMPHPLDMLKDPRAYGFEGAISRDHDPRSYKRAINTVISQRLRQRRPLGRHRRRHLWWPLLISKTPSPSFNPHLPLIDGPLTPALNQSSPIMLKHLGAPSSTSSSLSPSSPRKRVLIRSSSLIASEHIHMGLAFILSMTSNLFSSLLSLI